MKRMVIDKNMFERNEVRDWLAQSKDHIVVVTDYAQLEMLKGNALVNILKSTEILAAFPNQVHVLKPVTVISGLRGKKKGLKKRLTSGGATRSFRKWCKKRARAEQGEKKMREQILCKGEQAAAQLADMLADMKGFADNFEDVTNQFTEEQLAILRKKEPLTADIVLKIFDGTMNLAMKFFALHPDIDELPEAHEVPHTFIFRMALCAYIHALRWRVAGGAADALPERMRNDVLDVTFAAYALCFDGLLSRDNMANEIHDNAWSLLQLFTKYAPKSRGSRVQGRVVEDAATQASASSARADVRGQPGMQMLGHGSPTAPSMRSLLTRPK
jgi:hypothetical protein